MNKLFECIGALVLTIIMLGVPILFALSLVFYWGNFIFVILGLLTMIDIIVLFIGLCAFADFFD